MDRFRRQVIERNKRRRQSLEFLGLLTKETKTENKMKQVKVGDYVKLNNGLEGDVRQISLASSDLFRITTNMKWLKPSDITKIYRKVWERQPQDHIFFNDVPFEFHSDGSVSHGCEKHISYNTIKIIYKAANNIRRRGWFTPDTPMLSIHTIAFGIDGGIKYGSHEVPFDTLEKVYNRATEVKNAISS